MRLFMPAVATQIAARSAAQRVSGSFKTVKTAFERIDSEVRLFHYKVRNFQPNVGFCFERGPYVIKTVENGAELEECLKLRFQVFHKEYMNKKRDYGVDLDRLDEICDHLMIYDKRRGKTIGTYRLNSSLFTDTFYSASEFSLDGLTQIPGNKLELGRACISREYRTGAVIALLWRGIAEYIRQTDSKIMFGCSSIKTISPMEIGLYYRYLRESGHVSDNLGVQPTRKYQVSQLSRVLQYLDSNPFEYIPAEIQARIPALFASYLRMGAKLAGEPALDREFHCIDFLTVVKMDELNPSVREKYGI